MHQKDSGFTLIEMMVTVAVAAILLSIAVPSFTQLIDKKRLESAAESLYVDLQFARSEAIKRNKTIRVSFNTDGSIWCYGLKVNDHCDCQQTDPKHSEFCWLYQDKTDSESGIPTSVSSTKFKSVILASSASYFSFTPLRGTVNGGHVEFQSANNEKLRVVVSRLARVRLCSPSEGHISGYPVC